MKILNNMIAVISGLAAVIVGITLSLVLLGYRPFVLMSSSMEPLYKEGSLCFVNTRIPLDALCVGDVLVYRTSDILVLHRLVEIDGTEDGMMQVRMQGDTNNIAQSVSLSDSNYVGREAFTVPGLGSAVTHILSASVFIWWLAAGFVVLACIPWTAIARKKAAM